MQTGCGSQAAGQQISLSAQRQPAHPAVGVPPGGVTSVNRSAAVATRQRLVASPPPTLREPTRPYGLSARAAAPRSGSCAVPSVSDLLRRRKPRAPSPPASACPPRSAAGPLRSGAGPPRSPAAAAASARSLGWVGVAGLPATAQE